jgi:hypothetical protein
MESDLLRTEENWTVRGDRGLFAHHDVPEGEVVYLPAIARLKEDGIFGFEGYSMTEDSCVAHSNVVFDVRSDISDSVLKMGSMVKASAEDFNAVIMPNFLLTQSDVEEALDTEDPLIAYLIVTVKAVSAGQELLVGTDIRGEEDLLAWMHNDEYCETHRDTLNKAYNALDAWIMDCNEEVGDDVADTICEDEEGSDMEED